MFKWLGGLRRKSGNFNSVLSQLMHLNDTEWSQGNYAINSREAYQKNVVAYWCINSISKMVAGIPLIIKVDGKEIETDARNSKDIVNLINLLKRPNHSESYKAFMRKAVMQRLISGNTYMLGNKVYTGRIMDLQLMRPDCVEIKLIDNIPYAYVYSINGKQKEYEIDPSTYISEVLHIKDPNPLCDLYGQSPVTAARLSIDQHNKSSEWNNKLLNNSAKPPGILVFKDKGDLSPNPSNEQLDKMRDELHEKIAGYKNAGKIPVLGFEMMWQSLGLSPADMDWINGKNSSARDICLAFNVPPLLLGLPEASTFNNVSEAKLALYEDTIIPLQEDMVNELSYYLSNHQNKDIEITPDLDKVSALTPRREVARTSARADCDAGIITPNEARAEGGYEEIDGADELLVPAGKLPLNFDLSQVDQQKFAKYLEQDGFSKEDAIAIAKTAYQA